MNIRELVEMYIGTNQKKQAHIKRAKISDSAMSRFLNKRGGLDIFAGIRLLLAMEFKLVDKRGNVVLGKTKDIDTQIQDNILLPIDTEQPTTVTNE